MGEVGISGFVGDFDDGFVRLNEIAAGTRDAKLGKVVDKSFAHDFVKPAAESRGRKADPLRRFNQTEFSLVL